MLLTQGCQGCTGCRQWGCPPESFPSYTQPSCPSPHWLQLLTKHSLAPLAMQAACSPTIHTHRITTPTPLPAMHIMQKTHLQYLAEAAWIRAFPNTQHIHPSPCPNHTCNRGTLAPFHCAVLAPEMGAGSRSRKNEGEPRDSCKSNGCSGNWARTCRLLVNTSQPTYCRGHQLFRTSFG